MKQKLLAALGKSTDITINRGSFLDGEKHFRAVMFGKLELEDENTNCFCVRRDENSSNYVSFTPDMVTSCDEISQYHVIIIIQA